jgi:trigger factor
VTEGGVEKFRADVRRNMERELRNNIRARVKNAVFDALLAANPVEVPKALLSQEVDRQRQQAIQRFGGNAQNIKPEMLPNELFEEASRRSVALGLLLSEIIAKNDVKVDGDRVKTLVGEIAESYEDPAEVIAWYMSNREQRAQVESAVLEDQIVDLVLASAQISDKAVGYSELLRQQQ